jgi:hypothetical protein
MSATPGLPPTTLSELMDDRIRGHKWSVADQVEEGMEVKFTYEPDSAFRLVEHVGEHHGDVVLVLGNGDELLLDQSSVLNWRKPDGEAGA